MCSRAGALVQELVFLSEFGPVFLPTLPQVAAALSLSLTRRKRLGFWLLLLHQLAV